MQFETRFIEKCEEAKDIITFKFEKPADFTYKAGQHGHLILKTLTHPDERGNSHEFTFSSSPTENYLSFTTKIRQESGFKQSCLDLRPGDIVEIRGPGGVFVLEDEKTTTSQIMIAGGIGITPYRSIIKYVSDSTLSLPIHLIYSVTIPEELAFREELDAISQKLTSLKITYTVTRPEESSENWTGRKGRVDEKMIREVVPDINAADFWVCGPPPMVEGMQEILQSMQIAPEKIKTERFKGY